MTQQICDFFEYEGEEYCLMGYTGGILPRASDFGMKFSGGATSNWAGYRMWYGIHQQTLVTKRIEFDGQQIGVVSQPYRIINGRYYDMENMPIKLSGYVLFSEAWDVRMLYNLHLNESWKLYEAEVNEGNVVLLEEISNKVKDRISDLEEDSLYTWGINDPERLRNLRQAWDKTTDILARRYDVLYRQVWYVNFREQIEELQNNV